MAGGFGCGLEGAGGGFAVIAFVVLAIAFTSSAGSRCAVNLGGIDFGEIERGDWLLHPALARPTDRLDLRLELLADAPRKLG